MSNFIRSIIKKVGTFIDNRKRRIHEQPKEKNISPPRILNRLTGALVFVTLVQVGINIGMWRQVSKQTTIFDSTLAQTKRSIDIAENASIIQEKYAKVEARAYMCYDSVDNYAFNIGFPKKIEIKFINTGKTHAFDLRSESHANLREGHTDVSQEEIDAIPISKKRGRVVGAGQTTIVVVTESNYTHKESRRMHDGFYYMFVYGRVFYNDMFNEPHFTNYCISYRTDKKRFLTAQYGNNAN